MLINKRFNSRSLTYSAVFLIASWHLYYIFLFPVNLPFVDDWVLVPWLLHNTSISFHELFNLINGHQNSGVKLSLYAIGYLNSVPFQFTGLVGILLISLSALNFVSALIPSDTNVRQSKLKSIGILSLVLIVMTPRQFQNFFMIICIHFVISIYLVSKYTLLTMKTPDKLNSFQRTLFACIASTIGGLGTSLLLCHVFLLTFQFRKNMARCVSHLFISLTALGVTIFLPPIVQTKNVSQLTSFDMDLQNFTKFFLAMIGQPFVLWSINSLNIAIFFGITILMCSALVLFKINKDQIRIPQTPFVPFLTGLFFVLLSSYSRSSALGPIGAIEPRYTTGALLVSVGLIGFVNQARTMMPRLAPIFMIFALIGLSVGQVGYHYYFDRHIAYKDISNCLQVNSGQQSTVCIDKLKLLSLGASDQIIYKVLYELDLIKR